MNTVFHRRGEGSADFNRSWTDYVNGFGNISGEFWLGLSTIDTLTYNEPMLLRVDIIDGRGQRRYVEYRFSMWGADRNYELEVWGYRGDAGDGLKPSHQRVFSTYDRDPTGCVRTRHSAWWYPDGCGSSYLNSPNAYGNAWGDFYNLQFSEMKIKPWDITVVFTPPPW